MPAYWIHFVHQHQNLCGASLFVEQTNLLPDVTCPDCLLRLLASIKRDESVILATLAGSVALLQKAATATR